MHLQLEIEGTRDHSIPLKSSSKREHYRASHMSCLLYPIRQQTSQSPSPKLSTKPKLCPSIPSSLGPRSSQPHIVQSPVRNLPCLIIPWALGTKHLRGWIIFIVIRQLSSMRAETNSAMSTSHVCTAIDTIIWRGLPRNEETWIGVLPTMIPPSGTLWPFLYSLEWTI